MAAAEVARQLADAAIDPHEHDARNGGGPHGRKSRADVRRFRDHALWSNLGSSCRPHPSGQRHADEVIE
jgi:hypothetical protein